MHAAVRPLALLLAVAGAAIVLPAVLSAAPADAAPAAPPTSRSHYVRNITGGAADSATMQQEGCADAKGKSRIVVLDIGAQSVSAPLSSANPGVVLSGGSRHLTYASLVTAVDGYALGFHTCNASAAVTVAVTTNNDGNFTAYPAATKGSDWASKVVDPVRTYVAAQGLTGVAVIAGIDIEAGFASTATQARAWESAYLATTTANLVYVGSADGCPTTVGTTGKACARVRDDNGVVKAWTQGQYYIFAHNGSRIRVIPQIYVSHQATQWANIDLTGGKALAFSGALTEYATCPVKKAGCPAAVFTPAQGWTALWTGLNRIHVTPGPIVTDLRVDS